MSYRNSMPLLHANVPLCNPSNPCPCAPILARRSHVAARIRKMTDMTTSVITLSSAVDEGYTQAHVDSALQVRRRTQEQAAP